MRSAFFVCGGDWGWLVGGVCWRWVVFVLELGVLGGVGVLGDVCFGV